MAAVFVSRRMVCGVACGVWCRGMGWLVMCRFHVRLCLVLQRSVVCRRLLEIHASLAAAASWSTDRAVSIFRGRCEVRRLRQHVTPSGASPSFGPGGSVWRPAAARAGLHQEGHDHQLLGAPSLERAVLGTLAHQSRIPNSEAYLLLHAFPPKVESSPGCL